ncbi:MAG: FUSC family protein [Candidatus Dormiibacterota bacterium]
MTGQATVPAAREVAPSSPRGSPDARSDVRRVALHRAVRAAVVNPLVFAVTLLVFRDLQIATFAVFGCFGLLVMADFGGPRRPRAAAYAGAALAGAVLVALGTAVSLIPAAAAAVMLVVGFVISFASVFGGYVAAAQTALLLAFVLAASVAAPASTIPTRLAGWALAAAVSTVAGVFFWPWFEHAAMRRRAADACLALADLVAAVRHSAPDLQVEAFKARARAEVSAVRQAYAHTGMRPAGPTRRDRAFVELVTQLDQVVTLTERPLHQQRRSQRPCIKEGDRLASVVVVTLRADAAVLTGGPPPSVRDLEDARRAHRLALDRWAAAELNAGRSPEEVLEGIDVDHTLRVIAYLTIALSTNAVIAAGGRPDEGLTLPAGTPRLEGTRGIAVRTLGTLRTHLAPSSTVLHSSARVAVGLAVSVLLARVLGVEHAFWVVLGALSVLRSNALATGRTTVQALMGSVVGFVVGGLFASVAGNNPVLMWLAMPIAIFVASYAASAIGFMAGQAGFTVMVIIVFNLISPAGWRVGLVRIEDVALGTGISLVAGLLLWPRGARRDLARATAGEYRAVRVYLDQAFQLVLGRDASDDVTGIRAAAVRARDRAGEAFDAFLSERGAKPLDADAAARLVSAGGQALLAGDLLVVVATDLGYRADACPESVATVEAQVHSLLTSVNLLANQLAGERDDDDRRIPHPSSELLRAAALDCMRRSGSDQRATRGAMAVVIASEWVENLARTEADLHGPVEAAAAAARIRWWR